MFLEVLPKPKAKPKKQKNNDLGGPAAQNLELNQKTQKPMIFESGAQKFRPSPINH